MLTRFLEKRLDSHPGTLHKGQVGGLPRGSSPTARTARHKMNHATNTNTDTSFPAICGRGWMQGGGGPQAGEFERPDFSPRRRPTGSRMSEGRGRAFGRGGSGPRKGRDGPTSPSIHRRERHGLCVPGGPWTGLGEAGQGLCNSLDGPFQVRHERRRGPPSPPAVMAECGGRPLYRIAAGPPKRSQPSADPRPIRFTQENLK